MSTPMWPNWTSMTAMTQAIAVSLKDPLREGTDWATYREIVKDAESKIHNLWSEVSAVCGAPPTEVRTAYEALVDELATLIENLDKLADRPVS